MVALSLGTPAIIKIRAQHGSANVMGWRFSCGGRFGVNAVAVGGDFPSFLPKEVNEIKDPFARTLAQRIQRLPVKVGFSDGCIMSSCVNPRIRCETNTVVLLHCFDSSCLEWRCTLPLLEDAALETWAIDVLGWGFSDLGYFLSVVLICTFCNFSCIASPVNDLIFVKTFVERLPPCDAASKRYHLYQLWRTHIRRPMVLVGPSLGAAVAIDFAVNFPEAVDKLVLIDACVYAEGTGILTKLPKSLAYAGVTLLKSIPLRFYANLLAFENIPLSTCFDWTNVGRLHCLLPWWEDATVNYMLSGGYSVSNMIKQVKQKVLIIWGERDHIVSSKVAMRLHNEIPNAIMRLIPECGHLPHVEKPHSVAKLISDFARSGSC